MLASDFFTRMLEKPNGLSVNCAVQLDQLALTQCGALAVLWQNFLFSPSSEEAAAGCRASVVKKIFSRTNDLCRSGCSDVTERNGRVIKNAF